MSKPRTTIGFIRKGLKLLKNDFPERYETAVRLVGLIPGRYLADNDQFAITAQNGSILVSEKNIPKRPRIRAEISHKAIILLVDGTDTLQNLLTQEKFIIYADTEALLILTEVLKLVLSSAIWSAALQNHFEDYRKWVYKQNGKSINPQ